MNFLSVFKRNPGIDPDLKKRMLKNNDAILEVMGEKLDGNKCCAHLSGNPCIGKMCMQFMEFKNINAADETSSYWRCAHVQTPMLLIEVAQAIRQLIQLTGGNNENNQNNQSNP